jgi:hypothetical protein
MNLSGEPARTVERRNVAAFVVAVVAGVGIAMIDLSPGWDSTGITAGLLLGGAWRTNRQLRYGRHGSRTQSYS